MSMVGTVAATVALAVAARPAAAEEPERAAPAKPRPMATTADELFPPAPAGAAASAGAPAPASGAPAPPPAGAARPIPPSLLVKPPGSGPAPYGKGPSATPPVAVEERPLDEGAGYGDANATSNFLAPTAIMPPAGSVAFHSYELLVIGASYSPADSLSLSAQVLAPLVDDAPFVGLFSGKLQLHRSDTVRLALHGTAFYADGNGDGSAAYGLAGGVVTFCVERECESHVSGYAGFGVGREDSTGVPLILSGGFVGKLGKTAKVLLELDTGGVLGEQDEGSVLLAIYGLRLCGKTFALDAGFAKLIGDFDDDIFPLGYPLVNFSVRP